jgi:hypothetical protein
MDEMTQRRIRDLAARSTPPATSSQRTTDWREQRRNENRGTILIASANHAFVGVVGGMVVDNGFTPAYPADQEAPWLSVTRTQPCIVICDYDAPVDRIQQLVREAWARHVPVLASATEQFIDAPSLKPKRVVRFRLPVSREEFSSMIDGLLPSVTTRREPRDDERRGSRRNAGVRRRTLPIAQQDLSWSGYSRSARNGHSDVCDNARADDDGMAVPA